MDVRDRGEAAGKNSTMSTAAFINLHGYAAKFCCQVERADRVEFFDPGCFDEHFVNAAANTVFLNYGCHDSEPICSRIGLWKDSYGLGFVASVPQARWYGIRPGVMSDASFCSINVVDGEAFPIRLNGEIVHHIVRARIDHVCLCALPVSGTGVWPAQFDGTMPPRLARLAARWAVGRRVWLRDQAQVAADRAAEMNKRITDRNLRSFLPKASGQREPRSGSNAAAIRRISARQ
jgi:hypothetical protein